MELIPLSFGSCHYKSFSFSSEACPSNIIRTHVHQIQPSLPSDPHLSPALLKAFLPMFLLLWSHSRLNFPSFPLSNTWPKNSLPTLLCHLSNFTGLLLLPWWPAQATNTLDGFFSLEHTKLIPQIRNLSLCLKGFVHRFSNVLVLSCHWDRGSKIPPLRDLCYLPSPE